MKNLGNGRFEDVDGRILSLDQVQGELAALREPCLSCADELADGDDGICGFCREDEKLAARSNAADRQAEQRARLKRWLAGAPIARAS